MAFQWELVSFDSWRQDVLLDSGWPALSATGERETVLAEGEEWVTVRGLPRLPEIEWANGELEAAARVASSALQEALYDARPVDRGEALALESGRHLYLLALYELSRYSTGSTTWRLAKEVEAECAPHGQPLAICLGTYGASVVKKKEGVGSRALVSVGIRNGTTLRVPVGPYGGCLGTFPDVPFSRGNCWPTWCPRCARQKTNARVAKERQLRREWSS